jgi:hypothetical protein
MSQEKSPAPTPTAHTGLSQDMGNFHFPTYANIETQTEEHIEIKSEDPEPSIGNQALCLVVSRTGADGSTRIKPFLVPNTFYVIPDSASDEEKESVQNKIDNIAHSYAANQYTVQRQEFKVPFTVDVISRVSAGYIQTKPKSLTVEDVQITPVVADTAKKGRKRAVDDDEPRTKRGRKE